MRGRREGERESRREEGREGEEEGVRVKKGDEKERGS